MSTNMLMNGLSPVGMVYNQSAENIAYDSDNSVKDKIDSPKTHNTVWTGAVYNVNESFTIPNFSSNKVYLFTFRGFSSGFLIQFARFCTSDMQFIVQGETSQYIRYRFNADSQISGKYNLTDKYGTGDSGASLIQIDEII